jgi:hypothetical protein
MAEDNQHDESSDAASENEYDEAEALKDEQDDMMAESSFISKEENGEGDGPAQLKKPKLDPRDPLRPRRKKARRACFACQRAHLTCGRFHPTIYHDSECCLGNLLLQHSYPQAPLSPQFICLRLSLGDERPCQRCIKRGLADACQDGVRKKAKYLHDAPPEALRPVLGPTYNPARNDRSSGPLTGSTSASDTSPGVGGFFPPSTTSPTYTMQYQQIRQTQMPPPLQEPLPYTGQRSPVSPTFQTQTNPQPVSMPGMTSLPMTTNDIQNQTAFSGPLFDPSNPALFNFDLEGLNFGNHYGALEFGMLNHMSSGAADTPPQHKSGSMSQVGNDSNFNTGGVFNNMGQYGQMYSQDAMIPEFGMDSSPGTFFDLQRGHIVPRAYAIETGSTSLASPSTDAHASPQPSLGLEGSPTTTTYGSGSIVNNALPNQSTHNRLQKRQDTKAESQSFMASNKRTRDPSSIYTSVTKPYSYTTGFHKLTAFIQRRFSANATLKIAKSLASIRPSFISCTKALKDEDLIFMEKCFQRTLFEYEEFMRDWGTPTIVCRRTGEVAAVNKEFTLLTGWSKSVLLGREPNLNVNTGKSSKEGSGQGSQPSSGRAVLTTPRMRSLNADLVKNQEGRLQAVFIAELLDDHAVIEFYDDFAKLAFGDSRGSVTRRCKLLKYQTKEDAERAEANNEEKASERKRKEPSTSGTLLGGRVSRIDGENGIGRLERDGKMDCTYCWTVKRDVFDIPMLIVMNVRIKPSFTP